MAENRRVINIADSRVFVDGISLNTSDEEFQQYFERYGRITNFEVFRREDGRPSGLAYIVYADASSVQRTLNACPHYLNRKLLILSSHSSKSIVNTRQNQVIIEGLPAVTLEELRECFSQFGRVKDVSIKTDGRDSNVRVGYVTFTKEVAMDRCVGRRFVDIKQKLVEVKRAISKSAVDSKILLSNYLQATSNQNQGRSARFQPAPRVTTSTMGVRDQGSPRFELTLPPRPVSDPPSPRMTIRPPPPPLIRIQPKPFYTARGTVDVRRSTTTSPIRSLTPSLYQELAGPGSQSGISRMPLHLQNYSKSASDVRKQQQNVSCSMTNLQLNSPKQPPTLPEALNLCIREIKPTNSSRSLLINTQKVINPSSSRSVEVSIRQNTTQSPKTIHVAANPSIKADNRSPHDPKKASEMTNWSPGEGLKPSDDFSKVKMSSPLKRPRPSSDVIRAGSSSSILSVRDPLYHKHEQKDEHLSKKKTTSQCSNALNQSSNDNDNNDDKCDEYSSSPSLPRFDYQRQAKSSTPNSQNEHSPPPPPPHLFIEPLGLHQISSHNSSPTTADIQNRTNSEKSLTDEISINLDNNAAEFSASGDNNSSARIPQDSSAIEASSSNCNEPSSIESQTSSIEYKPVLLCICNDSELSLSPRGHNLVINPFTFSNIEKPPGLEQSIKLQTVSTSPNFVDRSNVNNVSVSFLNTNPSHQQNALEPESFQIFFSRSVCPRDTVLNQSISLTVDPSSLVDKNFSIEAPSFENEEMQAIIWRSLSDSSSLSDQPSNESIPRLEISNIFSRTEKETSLITQIKVSSFSFKELELQNLLNLSCSDLAIESDVLDTKLKIIQVNSSALASISKTESSSSIHEGNLSTSEIIPLLESDSKTHSIVNSPISIHGPTGSIEINQQPRIKQVNVEDETNSSHPNQLTASLLLSSKIHQQKETFQNQSETSTTEIIQSKTTLPVYSQGISKKCLLSCPSPTAIFINPEAMKIKRRPPELISTYSRLNTTPISTTTMDDVSENYNARERSVIQYAGSSTSHPASEYTPPKPKKSDNSEIKHVYPYKMYKRMSSPSKTRRKIDFSSEEINKNPESDDQKIEASDQKSSGGTNDYDEQYISPETLLSSSESTSQVIRYHLKQTIMSKSSEPLHPPNRTNLDVRTSASNAESSPLQSQIVTSQSYELPWHHQHTENISTVRHLLNTSPTSEYYNNLMISSIRSIFRRPGYEQPSTPATGSNETQDRLSQEISGPQRSLTSDPLLPESAPFLRLPNIANNLQMHPSLINNPTEVNAIEGDGTVQKIRKQSCSSSESTDSNEELIVD